MSEDLQTCPDCAQTNFTAKGLKTHQVGKTCQRRAAQKNPPAEIVADLPALLAAHAESRANRDAQNVEACVARFHVFHGVVKGNVLALKLAKFFGGIEVQTLVALHGEIYGETRGRPAADENNGSLSVISLGDFLEEKLGVSERTARRYRAHFESCTQEQPELADKLRKWWLSWKDSAALKIEAAPAAKKGKGGKAETQLATTSNTQTLALHEVCNLAAKDIEDLVKHSDIYGLHELFEVPAKDVTEVEATPADDSKSKANKEKLAKFWLQEFSRRALNNEFLKLPKQQKEAVLTTLEEAVTTLRRALKKGEA